MLYINIYIFRTVGNHYFASRLTWFYKTCYIKMLNVVRMPSCSFMDYNTYITWKHLEKNFGPTFQVRPKICIWPPDYFVVWLLTLSARGPSLSAIWSPWFIHKYFSVVRVKLATYGSTCRESDWSRCGVEGGGGSHTSPRLKTELSKNCSKINITFPG